MSDWNSMPAVYSKGYLISFTRHHPDLQKNTLITLHTRVTLSGPLKWLIVTQCECFDDEQIASGFCCVRCLYVCLYSYLVCNVCLFVFICSFSFYFCLLPSRWIKLFSCSMIVILLVIAEVVTMETTNSQPCTYLYLVCTTSRTHRYVCMHDICV